MGMLGDRAAEVFKSAMESYGIEPGEVHETTQEAMEVINDLAPVVERIDEISAKMETDMDELHGEIREFNNNSERMVDAFEKNAEAMEKVADVMKDIDEGELEE